MRPSVFTSCFVALAFCLVVGSSCLAEETLLGRPIEPFALSDYRGKNWSLDDFADKQLVVVAFLGTECPLVKLYAPRLEQIAAKYASRGVAVIGVNANSHDSLTEIAAFARRQSLTFPLLKDGGNRVADQFGARRTPEVFVLDAARKVRYHGRVDDQHGIGYTRDKPQRRDLNLAIDELLAGKEVSVAETPTPGCYIGRARQPRTDSPVTYSRQISRLLQARCVECHRPGDIAPFSLLNYEEVAGWAETIGEVVREERMPPWHAAPGVGHFAGERRLTNEEKELIAAWVKAGAPEGDPSEAPAAPQFAVEGWQLPKQPDQVITMEQPFAVPATGTVRYQFFSVDPGFTEDKWVSALQVRPSNLAVVHHVIVFARKGNLGEGADENGAAGFLAAYVPGLRAPIFPEGMARKVPAGAKIVFQIHYTPNGSPQIDQTELGLVFTDADKVSYEVRNTSALFHRLQIPPGDDNYRVEATSAGSPLGAKLLAFMPHMHLRGKSFSYEAIFPDGKKEMLLDIPHYDFNWQTRYVLPEPRELPPGTKMHVVAHFDNSAKNLSNPDPTKTVRWGQQTWEEMMIGYFDIAIPIDVTKSLRNAPNDIALQARIEMIKLAILRLDKNGDGMLERSEIPEQYRGGFDSLAGERKSLPVEVVQRAIAPR